jgi:hypothetical protein
MVELDYKCSSYISTVFKFGLSIHNALKYATCNMSDVSSV